MPTVLQSREGCPRAEYVSPSKTTSVTIEAEGLTPEQVDAVMRSTLEAICDIRGAAKPRLTSDRTRLTMAAALDKVS